MDKNYDNPIEVKVQSLIYDCDRPEELAMFYAKLLGGKVDSDPYGGYSVTVPGLGIDLGFQVDEQYKRPVWLGSETDQQPMLHLDLKVKNRKEAIDYAVSLGAIVPEKQFCQLDWDVQWITLLDPAGHPFCFFDE